MAELDENRALQTLVAKRVPRAYPLTRSAAARHRALTQKIRDALTELHMVVTSSDEVNTRALLHFLLRGLRTRPSAQQHNANISIASSHIRNCPFVELFPTSEMEVAHLYFLLWCAHHVPDVAIATAAPNNTCSQSTAAAARVNRKPCNSPRARRGTAPARTNSSCTLPPSGSKVSVPYLPTEHNYASAAPRGTTRELAAAAAAPASHEPSRRLRARQEAPSAHVRGSHALRSSTGKISMPHPPARVKHTTQGRAKPAAAQGLRRQNCDPDDLKRCKRPLSQCEQAALLTFLVGYALGILTIVVLLRFKEVPN